MNFEMIVNLIQYIFLNLHFITSKRLHHVKLDKQKIEEKTY